MTPRGARRGRKAAEVPQRQLEALLGATLFGAWDSSHGSEVTAQHIERVRSLGGVRRSVFYVLAAVMISATILVGYLGHARHQRYQLAQDERNLRLLLRAGELDLVVHILDGSVARDLRRGRLKTTQPWLWQRARRTVFRFHDASEVHLREDWRGLWGATTGAAYDAVVAEALRVRSPALAPLVEVARRDTTDPMAHLLLGQIYWRRGLDSDAERHLEAASRIEPSNLLVLTELARQQSARAAPELASTVARARDVNPASPWAAVVERLAGEQPVAKLSRALCAVETTAAVPRAEHCLLDALDLWRNKQVKESFNGLPRVAWLLNGQPLLIQPLADEQQRRGRPALAKRLTALSSLPNSGKQVAGVSR